MTGPTLFVDVGVVLSEGKTAVVFDISFSVAIDLDVETVDAEDNDEDGDDEVIVAVDNDDVDATDGADVKVVVVDGGGCGDNDVGEGLEEDNDENKEGVEDIEDGATVDEVIAFINVVDDHADEVITEDDEVGVAAVEDDVVMTF